MLRHAFETWKCIRVELKTDALNLKSRNAIIRIGAKEEGTLAGTSSPGMGAARHRLLQHPRPRVARSESEIGIATAKRNQMIKWHQNGRLRKSRRRFRSLKSTIREVRNY